MCSWLILKAFLRLRVLEALIHHGFRNVWIPRGKKGCWNDFGMMGKLRGKYGVKGGIGELMNKYLKKIVFMIRPVKRMYKDLENLRSQIGSLNAQLGRNAYVINLLDKLHEDAVESAWDKNNERKRWICQLPFTRVQIEAGGNVYTCCPDYLKQGNNSYCIGNIFANSFEEIWNSDKAKKLRYSVSQGNFEYCTVKCPMRMNPILYPDIMLPRENTSYRYDRWQDCSQEKSPTNIMTCIDSSCNLYCLTCRNHIHTKSDSENEQINHILENFVRPALRDSKQLTLDGSGDFLVSKPYLQFLQNISKSEYPSLQLSFFTNGQLFTPGNWEKFSNLRGMEISIGVSIDAASKDVYEKIRRGGKWETLCKNMEYISSLKISGLINKIIMRFVVQKGNFHQLEDFVSLGKKWYADTICFQRLINHGLLTPAIYAEEDVFSPENPLRAGTIRIITKLMRETEVKVLEEGCLNSV